MIALLLVVLLQAPEPTLDDRIAAFVEGDAAARGELVKLGVYAIRPLHKARDKAPERIDALILDLKKAGAHPRGSPVATMLDRKVTQVIIRVEPEVAVQFMGSAAVPLRLDFVAIEGRRFPTVTVSPDLGPLGAALDQVCRQTGLDYGFFHNTIVISTPERLWPPGPPPAPGKLGSADVARARALVERMTDESIESRESASRELLGLGPPVLHVLEENLSRRDGEIAARCRALRDELLAPGTWVVFGPPAAQRMIKSHKESSDAVAKLQATEMGGIGISASIPLSNLEDYLFEVSGMRFKIGEVKKSFMTVFHMRRQSLFDQLCLNLQVHGLDFAVRDGVVVIDTREAIEKLVAGQK